jgi:RHS repeat-associated protein
MTRPESKSARLRNRSFFTRTVALASIYALLFQCGAAVRWTPPLLAQERVVSRAPVVPFLPEVAPESATRGSAASSTAPLASSLVASPVALTAAAPIASLRHITTNGTAVVLSAVATVFDGITGIAHDERTNELLVATSGQSRDLELIAANGAHRAFSNLAGALHGARIAVARGSDMAGAFATGEVFAPSSNGSAILRVSADGATVQSAWVTLSGENITALAVDGTSTFGGDLIAVTKQGGVWRITHAAVPTRVATIPAALGSVTVVPNDPGRYGPWAGRLLAGAESQPVLYAIGANGATTSHALDITPRDLAVVAANENFFGIDSGANKIWGAASGAFSTMNGDVLIAQALPGVLARVHWNGTAFESSEIARVGQWQQITFARAGVTPIAAAPRYYGDIAVVRHAVVLDSGSIEGALWQLNPEATSIVGTAEITSDFLVPGTPTVNASAGAVGSVIEGGGSATPTNYSITLTGKSTVGHVITRTNAITLDAIAAPPAATGTRDVVLTSGGAIGDPATLRNLSLSSSANVSLPPGNYGALSATGKTILTLGVAGATQAAQYIVNSLTMSGGSELRVAGPIELIVRGAIDLSGSTAGSPEDPHLLRISVAGSSAVSVVGNALLFASVRAPQSSVTISGNGRVRGTVSSDRLMINGNGVLEVTETNVAAPPVNRPPAVDAGPDQTITLPNDSVTLNGTANDDGVPSSALTVAWTTVSGPVQPTFTPASTATTVAHFTQPGTYVLRLTANDSQLQSSDDVTVVVKPRNEAPVVNAGADQTIELPGVATLNATVSDDALPEGSTVTSTWSGPAGVTFATPNNPITIASFAAAGTYTLRLTATDTEFTVTDDVVVTVKPQNLAPVVNAGLDQTLRLPNRVALHGTATDVDPLTLDWTRASGPGEVHFVDSHARDTTATFDVAGSYVLRLTASDGRLTSSDDVTITVRPVNVAPVVDAGADQTIELPSVAMLSATVTDDDPVTLTWSGNATFSSLNAKTTTATFSAPGIYTLTLTANDGELSSSDSIVVTVRPQNVAPVVDAGADQTIRLPQTATLHATATDADPLTFQWSGNATFSNAASKDTTASFATPGTYVLHFTASDGRLSATDDVTITVRPVNVAPVVDAGADQAIELPDVASLNATVTDDDPVTLTWSGNATFSSPNAKTTTATFAAPGTYTLTLTANDGELSSSDTVVVTVRPQNVAPVVDAGADQTIRLPQTATLHATATDADALTFQWSGNATFSNAASKDTTASFATPGTYVLHFTASDGVTITVRPVNVAPVVDAGADQAIELPDVASLNATVTDDDPVTLTWSGNATFSSANAKTTTATFAAPGTYTLTLTANDGELSSSDTVVVSVRPQNVAPIVDAGADQTIRLPQTATLHATATDADPLTFQWSGNATFSNAASKDTTASFATPGTYVLHFTASDGRLSATDDVTITVLAANVAPIVDAGADQTIELPATASLHAFATDDGLPAPGVLAYAWSFASGPGAVTFSNGGTLPAVTATFSTPGTYVLRLTVSDGELSGVATTTVTVNARVNKAPVPSAGSDQTIDVSQPATLAGSAADDGLPVGALLAYSWSKVSGSGDVTFANSTSATTTATFSAVGTYVLRLTVSDTALTADDDVTITVAHIPVADFTIAGDSRNVARFNNNVANFGDGAAVVAVTSEDSTNAPGRFAIDESPYSAWRTASGQTANQSLTIRLAGSSLQTIDRVRIINSGQSNEGLRNFSVQVSTTTADDAAFTTVLTNVVAYHERIQEFPLAAAVSARYVRLRAIDNYGGTTLAIREFEVIAPSLTGITRYAYPVNLAALREGTTVIDSSNWVRNPILAIDENPSTFWYDGASTNAFFTLQLPQRALIERVQVLNGEGTSAVRDVRIEVAATAAGPFTVVATATLAGTAAGGYQDVIFPAGPVTASVLKFVAVTNYGSTSASIITELKVVPPAAAQSAVTSYENIYERPELMFDNNSGSGWYTQPGHVTNESVVVRIDAAEATMIDRVALKPMSSAADSVKDFDILVSATDDADASFVRVLSATLKNDGVLNEYAFPGGAVRARYVKLLAKNNYGGGQIQIATFEIRTAASEGSLISAPGTAISIRNLSPGLAVNGAKIVASSGGTPDVLLDYVEGSPWITAARTNQFATIQLGGTDAQTIDGVRVGPWISSITGTDQIRDFDVWVSTTTTDATAFAKVLSATMPPNVAWNDFRFPGGAVSARYVKYVPLTNGDPLRVNIVTGLFDVLQPVHPGGVVSASGFNGSGFPFLATDGAANGAWNVNTAGAPWTKIAMPGSQMRALYGLHFDYTLTNWGPKTFDVLVSTTTTDDAAFTLAYSGLATNSIRDFYFARTFDAKFVKVVWTSGYQTAVEVGEISLLTMTDDAAGPLSLADGISSSFLPTRLLDADVNNGIWASGTTHAIPEVIGVALPNGSVWRVDRVALLGRTDCGAPCDGSAIREFEVQASAGDGSDGTYRTVFAGAMHLDHSLQYFSFAPVLARFVRIVLKNNYAGAGEFTLQAAWVFSPQFGAPLTRFVDTSATAGAPIVNYAWDFGDGSASSDRDPVHTFAQPGTYDVSLTVTDGAGQTSRRTTSYHVLGAPTIDFTYSPAVGNEAFSVAFTDKSTSNYSALTSSNWSWGDGTADAIYAASASHTWLDNATYNVTHTVTNGRGITASLRKPVTILNVAPTANAGADVSVPWGLDWGVQPAFSDVSTVDRPTIRCSWNFGDGATSDVVNCATAAAPKHSYAAPGVYDATVTATDKDGGASTDGVRATVSKRPSLVTYSGDRAALLNQPIALKAVLREGITHDALANQTVTFDVDEQTATATTNAAGSASVSLIYTGASITPRISVSFAGNALYDASMNSFAVTCPAATQQLDVVMMTDVVRSRTAAQMTLLQSAEISFVDGLRHPADQVAIIEWGNPPRVLQTLTSDAELARKAIDTFTVLGSGNLSVALDTAKAELATPRHSLLAVPVTIALTDGTSVDVTRASTSAASLKAAGSRLVIVYFGSVDASMEANLRPMASAPADFYVARTYNDILPALVTITGTICRAANIAPTVDAGNDQTITSASTVLHGLVTDDGLAPGALTSSWTKVSGPGKVRFASPGSPVTKVTLDTRGTYVFRLSANDLQFTTFDDVVITVDADIVNAAPVVDAGADRFVSLPDVPPVPPLSLHVISNGGTAPIGIDYHQPTNKMVFSVNYPSGDPSNFALLAADGTRTNFSSVSRLTDELKIATARDDGNGMSRGGFEPGEVFSGSGAPGVIIRIAPDGSVVQNWVKLPGETGLMRGSLYIDRTGVFGGDLIAVTTTGGIWRVTSSGVATQLARVSTHLEGVTTVPNDPRYGPWAGRIIAGAENESRIYAVDPQGTVSFYALGIAPEDIDIIPAHENFFGIDFDRNVILGAPAEAFANWIGDFIIVEESGQMNHVWWNGTAFQKTLVAQTQHFEHVAFGPAGLGDIAAVGVPATLNGSVTDDGLPVDGVPTLVWTRLTGPAPVIFTPATTAVTQARFTAPGEYTLQLTGTDGVLTASDNVTVHVSIGNHAPVVDAGADQTVTYPANSTTLAGKFIDDNLPAGSSVTVTWSYVSGPAAPTFADVHSASTLVTFSAVGTYILRLTANDTQYDGTDDVVVVVTPAPVNRAPAVDAGADIHFVNAQMSAMLNGIVTDDGLPAGAPLAITWSKLSGPGTATFAAPNARSGNVTFSASGEYILQLSATDGALTTTDTLAVHASVGLLALTPAASGPNVTGATQLMKATLADAAGNPLFGETVTITVAGANSRVASLVTDPAGVALFTYVGANAGNDAITASVASAAILMSNVATVNWVTPKQNVSATTVRGRFFTSNGSGGFNASPTQPLVFEENFPNINFNPPVGTVPGNTSGVDVMNRPMVDVTTDVNGNFTGIITPRGNGAALGVNFLQDFNAVFTGTFNIAAAGDVTFKFWADDGFILGINNGASRVSGVAVNVPSAVTAFESYPVMGGYNTGTGADSPRLITVHFPAAGSYPFEVDYAECCVQGLALTLGTTAADGDRVIPPTVSLAMSPYRVDAQPVGSTQSVDIRAFDAAGVAIQALPVDLHITGANAQMLHGVTDATGHVTFQYTGSKAGGDLLQATSTVGATTAYSNELTIDRGTNTAPVVNAGVDRTIYQPNFTTTLTGSYSDDGVPAAGTPSYQWTCTNCTTQSLIQSQHSLSTVIAFGSNTTIGAYNFRLTASDGALSSSDDVVITLSNPLPNAAPIVDAGADATITLPTNQLTLNASVTDDGQPAAVTVSWSKVSGSGTVTFSAPTSRTTTATFSDAGTYALRIAATDSALTSTDDVTVTVNAAVPAPTAEITSPASGSAITDRTIFYGTVSAGTTWHLDYRLNGNDSGAAGSPWMTIASGAGALTNAPLGTFDPTLLLNGIYKVRLVATNASQQSDVAVVSVAVEGGLKVGLFSLTFNDLHIPLPGMSIRVDRTYDSRDTSVGDFGHGWRLNMTNLRVQKSGVLGTGWAETVSSGPFPQYCIAATAPHLVAFVMPNGKTYRFSVAPSPACQPLVPIQTPTMTFVAVGDTHGSLEAEGENDVITDGSIPGPLSLVTSDVQPYNPSIFRLTDEHGVIYRVSETAGVLQITDRSSNVITIGRDGISHSAGRSVTFSRDSLGRIAKITDASGKSLAYSYDANGDLTQFVDQTARTTSYTYDSAHHLVDYIDSMGRRGVRNDYDATGRLIAATDADGHTMKFAYDASTRREVMTDRRGQLIVYDYDSFGNVIRITDADGLSRSATFDATGDVLTSTDKLGHTTTYEYDTRGNRTKMTDAEGRVTSYAYNAFGQLLRVTNAKGQVSSMEYDASGHVVRTTLPDNSTLRFGYDGRGNMTTITDDQNNVQTMEYDSFGNVTKETDARGFSMTATYDAMGRKTGLTDRFGKVTAFAYDDAGRLTSTTDSLGNVTRNEYDGAGEVSAIVDSRGNRTSVASNGEALPTSVTRADGVTLSLEYEPGNTLTKVTRSDGRIASSELTNTGDEKKFFVAPGIAFTYELDAEGRRSAEVDPRGNQTTYVLDATGRRSAVIDALGNRTEFHYDAVGNMTSIIDANRNALTSSYDPLQRLTRRSFADGSYVQYDYDSIGRVSSAQDAGGSIGTYTYDAATNLKTVTDPNGVVTSAEYDANGSPTAVRDGRNHTVAVTYDELGRDAARTYPDGSTEHWTYEIGAAPKTMTDRAGRTTSFRYDSRNHPSAISYADGNAVTLTYTADDKLDVVSGPNEATDHDYDSRGNLVKVSYADGTIVAFTYDELNDRTSMTTPGGTTTYEYDALNRLSKVTDHHGHATKYSYDKVGNVTRIEYPNGLVTTQTFDAVQRVESTKTTNSAGTVVFGESYSYDKRGNRTEIYSVDGSSILFTYDALSRLNFETRLAADGTITRQLDYDYDEVGNRTAVTDLITGFKSNSSYDAMDQLLTDGTSTYAYDGSGNTRTATNGAAVQQYRYDARDLLTRVDLSGGGAVVHDYDARGYRVRTTSNGTVTAFLNDPSREVGRVLLERDSANQIVAGYTYGQELISAESAGAEVFYIYDALGSVRALTDANGIVTDRYTYDAFGSTTSHVGASTNTFLYRGERIDPLTGLYHLHSRDYDPAMGRFIERDTYGGTLQDPESRNRYAYARNNPVNQIDPTGRVSAPEGTGYHGIIAFWYARSCACWPYTELRLKRIPEAGIISKKAGGIGLRPDLVDFLTGDVYEIKPLSPAGLAAVTMEALGYVLGMNYLVRHDYLNAPASGSFHLGDSTFRDPSPDQVDGLWVRGHSMFGPGAVIYADDLRRLRNIDPKTWLSAAVIMTGAIAIDIAKAGGLGGAGVPVPAPVSAGVQMLGRAQSLLMNIGRLVQAETELIINQVRAAIAQEAALPGMI